MKAIITAALIIAASSAQAESKLEKCEAIAGLAESVMMARQAGRPMGDIIRVGREAMGEDEAFEDLVLDVYRQERYNSDQVKRAVIIDFRDDAMVACMRTLKDE